MHKESNDILKIPSDFVPFLHWRPMEDVRMFFLVFDFKNIQAYHMFALMHTHTHTNTNVSALIVTC